MPKSASSRSARSPRSSATALDGSESWIGGAQTSEFHAVVVAAEDNLRKGAAVQAVQNLNLAFGIPELCGLPI